MRSQSLIFTIFGDYILDHGGTIRASSLVRLMAEFGVTETAVRAELLRMRQKGVAVVTRIGKHSHYTLSRAGLRRLKDGTDRLYYPEPHPWDNKWRVFVYAVAETRRTLRDQLRKELAWYGMGQIAQSTWISPNAIETMLQSIIDEYLGQDEASVFLADHLGDSDQLVKRCWDLDRIRFLYEQFIEQWHPVQEQVQNWSDNEAFVHRIQLVHEFRKFFNIDPQLPESLLPAEWAGYAAGRLFRDLREALGPAADRFFRTAFEP
ncbi:MAG: transcriptional regulator PaaX [Sulfobacillus benefaciens]|uniref:Transcriptional regulator PaaX n=1 Tax=Sulfobacillus benefaciens TaxID=453960 RepID=A0A2T2XI11_9FIRM|nr:MAG: transcriptional regulator PaaX [Sulfobacillus benefaciens]